MQDVNKSTALEQARHASLQGRWEDAYDHLIAADAQMPLSAEDLPFLATVAYATGHLDAAIDAWERAHAMAILAGNRVDAAGAAARVAMHLLFDTALLAPVRAWLSRADQLLDGVADTPVHAWVVIGAPYELAMARMGVGDVLRAQGDDERGHVEFEAARTIFERIGAKAYRPVESAFAVDQSPTADVSRFLREGDYWLLAFDGCVARVRDAKGWKTV